MSIPTPAACPKDTLSFDPRKFNVHLIHKNTACDLYGEMGFGHIRKLIDHIDGSKYKECSKEKYLKTKDDIIKDNKKAIEKCEE